VHRPKRSVDRSDLKRALEQLHPESWGWALACARRDHELASEVLQAAYARMISGRARFDGRSSLRTWAFGVIRLTTLEELRRRRRSDSRFVGDDQRSETADLAPWADVLVEMAERAAALRDALTALSDRQREVLQLVFYHDMTIEEAARVMDVSLGTARTHYARAKAALATEIAHLREDVR